MKSGVKLIKAPVVVEAGPNVPMWCYSGVLLIYSQALGADLEERALCLGFSKIFFLASNILFCVIWRFHPDLN